MIVNFTKVGGMAMIQPAGGSAYLISNKPDFCLNAPMSVRVMSDFGYLSYDLTAITDIQVGGVAVLSQSDFLVQIATVFPNTNSGSGGTAVWGGITGTLANQVDLNGALSARALVRNITAVKTANYTAVPSDFIPVDTTSGNVIITLPTAPPNISMIAVKMVIQGGNNTVIVNTGGTDVINKVGGVVTRSLVLLNQDFILQYSNGIWYVVTESLNLATLDTRYLTGTTPSWGSITGTLSTQTDLFTALNNRALARNITAVKTANYTAVPSDFIPVDTTSGNITITLPTAPPNISMIAVKMVIQGGTNTVIVNTGGTDTINKIGGVVTRSLVLLNQDFILQYSNGVWYVVTESLNLATLDVRYLNGGTDYTGFESTGSTSLTITLPQTPRAGQLGAVKQFKNGVRLPNSKWSITGAVITLVDTPLTTDLFQSDFKY